MEEEFSFHSKLEVYVYEGAFIFFLSVPVHKRIVIWPKRAKNEPVLPVKIDYIFNRATKLVKRELVNIIYWPIT